MKTKAKKIRGRKPSLVSDLISLAHRLASLAGDIDRLRSIYLPRRRKGKGSR